MSVRARILASCLATMISPALALAGPSTIAVYVGPDLNGDANSDVVVEDITSGYTLGYLIDGVDAPLDSSAIPGTNVAAGYTTSGFPDLNGDGNSDKIVEHTTGYSVAYLLDGVGAPLESGAIAGTNVAAGYTTSGYPDLNGDGKADKVIEHTSSGYSVGFLMNGLERTAAGPIAGTNVAAGYRTIGYPDLDGDHKADKVIEHTSGYTVAFLMNGLTVKDAAPISGTNVAAGYATSGFPDLNNDGKADKVIEHTSGYTVAFLMDGTTTLDSFPIAATNVAAGYSTLGYPDLNGDGHADKVVGHTSGFTVAFIMKNGVVQDAKSIPGTPAGYGHVGFADLNGDLNEDRIIRKDTDGITVAFLMDGTVELDSGEIPKPPPGFDAVDWNVRWEP